MALSAGLTALALVVSPALAQSLSFLRGADLDVGEAPIAVVIGDLNSDGRPDLVTANNGTLEGGGASVLLADPAGGFQAAMTVEAGLAPADVALADVDGDTDLDAVIVDELENQVIVLLNDGAGNLTVGMSADTGEFPLQIAAADLDSDGTQDVVTADSFDDAITLQRGQGDGSFIDAESLPVGFEPVAVTVGDLDGDTLQDVVVANLSGGPDEIGSVSILPGEAEGGLGFSVEVSSETFNAPADVVVAKLDGDDIPDLVVVNEDSDDISILIGTGGFGFELPEEADPPRTAPVGFFPKAATVADFNGDGHADVATSGNFDDNVTVLLGDGSGGFTTTREFAVGPGPWGIASADLDNDGLPDIVCANLDGDSVSILKNTTGTAPTCVGDCNADGEVTVDEILSLVNIALGEAAVSQCEAGDGNDDGEITVDEILTAVNNALQGCLQEGM
jgi:hypothetical protein